jgi:WD40 repeat protein
MDASNPYVGPRSFRTGETLYGRDREARELLGLLVAERIVLLYSPSGAGKSSLVQAGLIPRLAERDFFVRPVIRVNIDAGAGGNRYLRSTLLSLEEGLPEAEQLPDGELAELSLDAYLARRPPPADADGEVLIFDQFEEVLTADPTDTAAKAAFFAQLGDALRDRDRWALFAMREDFVAGLDPYAGAIPTRLNTSFRLDLLGLDAAREVMRRPARAAGVEFEAAAADRLAADLSRVIVQRPDGTVDEQRGATVEPVQLQVVCRRLWDGLPEGATRIGAAEVAALGDVNRALADYYAAGVARAAAAGGTGERAVREWFERRLITPQGVRGTVLRGASDSDGLADAAVAALVDAYLVRGEKRRGATWLELAHDRLIAPVRADNAAWFAANLSPLQRQADLWATRGRPASLLLRDEPLAEAEAWAAANPADLGAVEAEFLARSQEARDARERERRQLRRIRALWAGAGVLLLALAAAGGFALWNQQRAEREARVARSRTLAAGAVDSLGADPIRSLILARAAAAATTDAGEPPTDEAREALQQAAQAARARRIVVAYPPDAAERGLQSLAFSPGGARIAAASNAGELLLIDAATGAVPSRIAADSDALNGIAYSPDSTRIAAATPAGPVQVWDAATGEQVAALEGHDGESLDVAYSPDSTRLASAGRDGTARIWDAATGEQLLVLEGHEADVNTAAFDPDGARVVTASDDGTARVWDAETGGELLVLEGHAGAVLDAAFSPDGASIATAGDDITLRRWDATDGRLLDVLRGHSGTVDTLAFSADGQLIATGSSDTTARIWSPAFGSLVLTLAGHGDAISGVAFAPDGRTLATSSQDGTVRLWDLGLAPPGGAYFVAYSPDGSRLATAGAAGATVWDPATGAALHVLPTEVEASSVAFGPGGRLLAVGTLGPQLLIADAASGEIVAELEESEAGTAKVQFSPDGALLATAGYDGRVRLWDEAAGRVVRELALRPAGSFEVPIFSLAFSPDGALLATGDEFGSVAVWAVASGERRLALDFPYEQAVNSLAFSPDGRLLAAADEEGAAWVWDAASGAELRHIPARAAVLDVAFSPNGALLATAGRDRAVTLWDVATWREAGRIPHPSEVNDVSFHPAGGLLATAAADGAARVLPLGIDDLLALVEERTLREPSAAECEAYGLVTGCGP